VDRRQRQMCIRDSQNPKCAFRCLGMNKILN
jgi:hypothetical protein